MHIARTTIVDFIVERIDRARTESPREMSLIDTGLSPYDIAELVFLLEDRLDLSIPYYANARSRAAESARTVGQLAKLVARLAAEAVEKDRRRRQIAEARQCSCFAIAANGMECSCRPALE